MAKFESKDDREQPEQDAELSESFSEGPQDVLRELVGESIVRLDRVDNKRAYQSKPMRDCASLISADADDRRNFALHGGTGDGKLFVGGCMCMLAAKEGRRSFYITPFEHLVEQVVGDLGHFFDTSKIPVVRCDGDTPPEERAKLYRENPGAIFVLSPQTFSNDLGRTPHRDTTDAIELTSDDFVLFDEVHKMRGQDAYVHCAAATTDTEAQLMVQSATAFNNRRSLEVRLEEQCGVSEHVHMFRKRPHVERTRVSVQLSEQQVHASGVMEEAFQDCARRLIQHVEKVGSVLKGKREALAVQIRLEAAELKSALIALASDREDGGKGPFEIPELEADYQSLAELKEKLDVSLESYVQGQRSDGGLPALRRMKRNGLLDAKGGVASGFAELGYRRNLYRSLRSEGVYNFLDSLGRRIYEAKFSFETPQELKPAEKLLREARDLLRDSLTEAESSLLGSPEALRSLKDAKKELRRMFRRVNKTIIENPDFDFDALIDSVSVVQAELGEQSRSVQAALSELPDERDMTPDDRERQGELWAEIGEAMEGEARSREVEHLLRFFCHAYGVYEGSLPRNTLTARARELRETLSSLEDERPEAQGFSTLIAAALPKALNLVDDMEPVAGRALLQRVEELSETLGVQFREAIASGERRDPMLGSQYRRAEWCVGELALLLSDNAGNPQMRVRARSDSSKFLQTILADEALIGLFRELSTVPVDGSEAKRETLYTKLLSARHLPELLRGVELSEEERLVRSSGAAQRLFFGKARRELAEDSNFENHPKDEEMWRFFSPFTDMPWERALVRVFSARLALFWRDRLRSAAPAIEADVFIGQEHQSRSERNAAKEQFNRPSEKFSQRVLFINDAACEGQNFADVEVVVNYEPEVNEDKEAQTEGRAARPSRDSLGSILQGEHRFLVTERTAESEQYLRTLGKRRRAEGFRRRFRTEQERQPRLPFD